MKALSTGYFAPTRHGQSLSKFRPHSPSNFWTAATTTTAGTVLDNCFYGAVFPTYPSFSTNFLAVLRVKSGSMKQIWKKEDLSFYVKVARS
ncbi:MAG: hypothetical protein Q4A71_01715 [Actinomycetaceae bacterium]|nr:hypothetical protein [Actinomycetaceae bacterium]